MHCIVREIRTQCVILTQLLGPYVETLRQSILECKIFGQAKCGNPFEIRRRALWNVLMEGESFVHLHATVKLLE